MKKQFRIMTAVLTACVLGLPALAYAIAQTDKQQGQAQTAATLDKSDREFVMKVAHGGKAEVELGRLAVERASNEKVKAFAQKLVDDHSKANDELMQLAASKGITIPQDMEKSRADMQGTEPQPSDTPSPERRVADRPQTDMKGTAQHDKDMNKDHEDMVAKLRAYTGADFDRHYISHMVKDHTKDVQMFERQASKGKDADLKAWAAKTLPTLREHLQMARALHTEIGGKAGK